MRRDTSALSVLTLSILGLSASIGWAVSLSACSGKPEPRYGPGERVVAEYLAESKTVQLAPGWQWPTDLTYPNVVDGDGIKYEINIGRVDAAWYWHCSWARTYLASDDQSIKDAALVEVLKLKTSSYYEWGLDEVERGRRDKVLDDVTRGDIKSFQQIINLNCPESPK